MSIDAMISIKSMYFLHFINAVVLVEPHQKEPDDIAHKTSAFNLYVYVMYP
jgi:hypothetical protein